ncbi:hypothetical protein RhiXN_09441 [Rhizoctonia solani]|uniref:Jacalin-type lectin domain-containing protein n=1 Tax=Rhizoctonia solani TaxID=456999 RepID=A0A8H8NY29_9AGAM|nr:uncharacterized protein RhiXN_09441 [Rhizoctonia solani]QRW20466.1 hypothetical protein RhiXN_09441 [Rhizoctonia solani]
MPNHVVLPLPGTHRPSLGITDFETPPVMKQMDTTGVMIGPPISQISFWITYFLVLVYPHDAASFCFLACRELFVPGRSRQPKERAAASSGSFNVLSMNVAGLPAILNPNGEAGDKTTNTMYIGQKMSQINYGIINVQEDFNYHATLYQYDTHPFRTATSGGYDWVDFERIKWDQCSNASESDCLTPKGFTFMRPGDEVARRSNIQQVADFINTHSAGNAVIVFGDTNSRYTRSDDNIRLFTTQNGLTDAWVQAIGGKAPAAGADAIVVDKVFYRGSPIINLKSSGFFYDTSRFLSPDGHTLTDHNPIRVDFGYTLSSGLRQSDLYGGPHGNWFNDLSSLPSSPKLASITLRGANRLDGFSLALTSGRTFTHGGSGGDAYSLALGSGEYITSATTNKGKSVQAGKTTGDCATATAPSGYGVVGTYGQDGDEVDQLGFIYAQQ